MIISGNQKKDGLVVLEDHAASADDDNEDTAQQWKRFEKVPDETIVNKTIRIKIASTATKVKKSDTVMTMMTATARTTNAMLRPQASI